MTQNTEKIATYISQQNRAMDLEWEIYISVTDAINSGQLTNLEVIKKTQSVIIEQEKTIQSIHLLVAFMPIWQPCHLLKKIS